MPKKVGRATYVHRSALDELSVADQARVRKAATVLPPGVSWSVARVLRQGNAYEIMLGDTTSFETDPHPALRHSVLVRVRGQTAKAGKPRHYSPDNRPIYHRKEQMLSQAHPQRAQFAALTAAEEQAGLLSRSDIGRQRAWDRLLTREGWRLDGHRLTRAQGSRALDLDSIVAGVVGTTPTPPRQRPDLDAIIADLRRGQVTRVASVELPGSGPDPMQSWLQTLGRKRPPPDMAGWPQRRRRIAQAWQPDLRFYDVILVNSSAGKDSIVTALVLARMAAEQGVSDRLVMVHADLGLVEWEGSAELAAEHAAILGMPFEVVRKPVDFLERIVAYGMWPSRSSRFCTGEYKTSEVEKLTTRMTEELTGTSSVNLEPDHYRAQLADAERAMASMQRQGRKINARTGKLYSAYQREQQRAESARAFLDSGLRPVRFLNVLGLRAAEGGKGGDRYKKAPFVRKEDTRRRLVDTWLPVHAWSDEEVWAAVNAGPLPPPATYACGMTRHSCMFCVMAGKDDLINAALLSPVMLDEYVQLQKTLTDPRINPWHGDVLRRGRQTVTVLLRQRPGQGIPHQITYTTDPVDAEGLRRAMSSKAAHAQFTAGFDVETVPIEQWRTMMKGAKTVALGRNRYLASRYFPPMPVQQIAFLTKRLQAQGVDPRKDKDAARAAINAAVEAWKAQRRESPRELWRPNPFET